MTTEDPPVEQSARPESARPDVARAVLLGRARGLAIFTVAWNVAEGVVALAAGVVAGSRALASFGLDSVVESISASVLLWRIDAERRDPERVDHVERTASRLIGGSFLVLGALVGFEALRALALGQVPAVSPVGIVLTAVSLAVMPVLARRKRAVARALGSRAGEADSAQTSACAWLSAVVLLGLLLNAAVGWWWADPVAALGVVVLLVREGRRALVAGHVDDCC